MGMLKIALESGSEHYSVYVVLLDNKVLEEHKYKTRNPQYINTKPCVYVGMTGIGPAERYKKHKAGIKSNVYAERYGTRLMPELTKGLNDLNFHVAKEKEFELAELLKRQGYAVWQA
jgi:hypothetical protein